MMKERPQTTKPKSNRPPSNGAADGARAPRFYFITATDTGVGKTVLTALLAAYYRECGIRVAAFKPVCSGGRDDARALRAALGGTLGLKQINPWHFRAPIAPVLAAELENKTVRLVEVVAHIRAAGEGHDVVLIEGAGGLLSPLGADFDSRGLISALGAVPIVAAPNRLGVVNHILLTLEALPERLRDLAVVVLMTPSQADSATASNAGLLKQLSVRRVCRLPWLGAKFSAAAILQQPRARQAIAAIAASVLPVPVAGQPSPRGRR
jgi:dethiobiotin synthetase